MDMHTCEKLISEIVFEKDIRNPPTHSHRGQFKIGWEAATLKGEIYTEDTLKTLTWHNLGYRIGKKLGNKHQNEINEIFDSLANHYFSRINIDDYQWKQELENWFQANSKKINFCLFGDFIKFFELAFTNTRYPEKAWFGTHASVASLVLGKIFLAAIYLNSSKDRGIWLLVDENAPEMEGIVYLTAKCTLKSITPLSWAYAGSFETVTKIIKNKELWLSYAEASEKIFNSPRASASRDQEQLRKGKKKLSDFWQSNCINEAQDISVKAHQPPIKLAQPFSQIFTNREETKWAFDLLQRTNEGLSKNAEIQLNAKDARQQDLPAFANAQQQLEVERYFDPKNIEDARERIITSITRRQGQSQFRRRLLKVYNSRCAITGCDAEPALEAAHIIPYKGADTNHLSNGLLLRADIHTLFDLHLLSVDPKTKTVLVAPSLADTYYSELTGKQLSPPLDEDSEPNREALEQHYKRFISYL